MFILISMLSMSWEEFHAMILIPPNGMWFIFLISLSVSLLSTTLNKILVDQDQLARMQETITAHQKKKKELAKMAEEDPKKYIKEYPKWQRRDASIQKMQQSMSLKRLKPTCFTFIPLIVFFYVVRNMFTTPGGIQIVIAKPPMNPIDEFPDFIIGMMKSEFFSAVGNIPISEGWMGFSGFYILCSFTFSMFIQRLFGINPQTATGTGGTGGMSQMFDTSAQMELPDPKTLM